MCSSHIGPHRPHRLPYFRRPYLECFYVKGGGEKPAKPGHYQCMLCIILYEKEITMIQICMSLRMPRVSELQGTSFSLGRADGTRLSALGMN